MYYKFPPFLFSEANTKGENGPLVRGRGRGRPRFVSTCHLKLCIHVYTCVDLDVYEHVFDLKQFLWNSDVLHVYISCFQKNCRKGFRQNACSVIGQKRYIRTELFLFKFQWCPNRGSTKSDLIDLVSTFDIRLPCFSSIFQSLSLFRDLLRTSQTPCGQKHPTPHKMEDEMKGTQS